MQFRRFPKRNILLYPDEYADFFRLFVNSFEDEGFVEEFEREFALFTGAREAIAVSSGRFALALILKNLGLRKGDGVLLSAYNYPGVPAALLREGLSVQFVDADDRTYQMDVRRLVSAIRKNSRAVIVTHLFGHPCELEIVRDICRKHGLFVIEDAAHSLGSYYREKHTGTIADVGLFSFSGSKILNTSFGGMAVTGDRELAGRIRKERACYAPPSRSCILRQRAATFLYALLTNRFFYSTVGYPLSLAAAALNADPLEIYNAGHHREIAEEKMRLSAFQAKAGLRYVRNMREIISQRRKYAQGLINGLSPSIAVQQVPDDCSPNYFMIALRARDKRNVYRKLLMKGIDTSLGYAYDCSYVTGDPGNRVAEMLGKSIVTLHLPFSLGEKDIRYLAGALNSIKDLLQ